MLQIYQRLIPNTRTARGSLWEARCRVDGQLCFGSSRNGAANDLARRLVALRVPDQPVEVYQAGLKGHMPYRSLYELARWTYSEGDSRLQRIPWRQRPVLASDVMSNTGGKSDGG